MTDKKLLQQLLIASEYLKLQLEEDRNYAYEIDGRTVSAASLRHDIEEAVKPYFEAAKETVPSHEKTPSADVDDIDDKNAPGSFTKQQEKKIIALLRCVVQNARNADLGFMLEGLALGMLEHLTGVPQEQIKIDIEEEARRAHEEFLKNPPKVERRGPIHIIGSKIIDKKK